MIPYGLSTLFFGLLADRFGRRRIIRISVVACREKSSAEDAGPL